MKWTISVQLFFCIPLIFAQAASGQQLDELDLKVKNIFQNRCVMCHDDLGEDTAGGDVNYLLKFEQLIDTFIDGDDPADSYLLELVPSEMPKKKMKGDIQWGGALSDEEVEDFNKWVMRGGPSKSYLDSLSSTPNRKIISLSTLTSTITADLGKLKSKQLQNARYLTLFNLHNNPDVSNEELETYRQAITKTLNSLSSMTEACIPEAIDEDKTIFRFDIRKLGWTQNQWDLIARHYPYEITQRSGIAAALYQSTSSALPYMRADWFVFATTQPPLYHQLVDIPQSLSSLESRLFGKPGARQANITSGNAMRAGFGDSGVSQNNRLIERHSIPTGAYWISYDFAANDGDQNLMTHPLGPIGIWPNLKYRDHEFKHDGGEVIFNLPNGFQGYGLYDAKGDRIDVGPSNIVHDDTMTGGAIINGISCISCHNKGMKPENQKELVKLDRVRNMALQNFRRFDEEARLQIEELYPEGKDFAKRVREDRKRFNAAMQQSGVSTDGDEPVRALFDRFVRDINANTVAAGLGVSTTDLQAMMNREGETRQLLMRLEDEGVKRQLFLKNFKTLVRLSGIGSVRDSAPIRFPFFNPNPTEATDPKWSSQNTSGQHTGVPILDEDNFGSKLQIQLETIGNKKHFRQGELVQFVVTASEDCYLHVTATDSVNDVTLLLPNKWHDGRIKKNMPTVIPTKDMDFEIFVEPPFGRTLVKAVGTIKPFQLKGHEKNLQSVGLANLGNTKSLKVRGVRTGSGSNSLSQDIPTSQWGTARLTIVTKK